MGRDMAGSRHVRERGFGSPTSGYSLIWTPGIWRGRRLQWSFAVLAAFSAASISVPAGQASAPGVWIAPQRNPIDNTSRPPAEFTAKQLRALNEERQRALVSDTARLLTLARELNGEVGAVSPDSLTAAQLRKVNEIEKLARSVKEKMSYAITGGPEIQLLLTPPVR